MQDGAPAQGLLAVTERFPEVSDNYAVTLQHEIEWPAQSPDLSKWLFLRSYMRFPVFATPSVTINDSRQIIFWSLKSWPKQILLQLLLEQWKNVITSILKTVENLLSWSDFTDICICNIIVQRGVWSPLLWIPLSWRVWIPHLCRTFFKGRVRSRDGGCSKYEYVQLVLIPISELIFISPYRAPIISLKIK